MALYKIEDYDGIYPSDEFQEIPIDPEVFFDKNSCVEVHAHASGREMAISPNNGSFLMSCIKPVLSFYSACAFKSSKKMNHLVVCLYSLV